ncbi:hypothetical protein [Roseomonas harenae]|uniref:hypothetical protein n=1 Tax=Muricoccus harenae TaxID=2692566 RepID=UPI001331238A|nr:hypothetical protein [Roseomonas harenae]
MLAPAPAPAPAQGQETVLPLGEGRAAYPMPARRIRVDGVAVGECGGVAFRDGGEARVTARDAVTEVVLVEIVVRPPDEWGDASRVAPRVIPAPFHAALPRLEHRSMRGVGRAAAFQPRACDS